MSKSRAINSEKLSQIAGQAALDSKALNVVLIDVRGRSSYADFLLIASGTSDRHVVSIAENIQLTLKKNHQFQARGIEGTKGGQWVLVDLNDVVVHVFHQFTRENYNLEEIWNEAPQHLVEDINTQAAPP